MTVEIYDSYSRNLIIVLVVVVHLSLLFAILKGFPTGFSHIDNI